MPYLSPIPDLAAVDKIVDNSRIPVDELWITRELSTGRGFPLFSPQVYPQIRPLLSTGLSTTQRLAGGWVVHNARHLSTASADKSAPLWIIIGEVIHIQAKPCGWVVDRSSLIFLFAVTMSLPWREGERRGKCLNVCF
jgi:hypothetical protein